MADGGERPLGHSLRAALIGQDSEFHYSGDFDSRPGHRRQYRHFQRHQRGIASAASVS